MEKRTERTWTKQDGEDASRLLAGMVRRAKKSSRPADEKSAEIHDSGTGPSSTGEQKGRDGANGEAARYPGSENAADAVEGIPAPAISATGEERGRRLVISNGSGSPIFSRGKFPVGYANDNGLPHREDVVLTDRAFEHAPGGLRK